MSHNPTRWPHALFFACNASIPTYSGIKLPSSLSTTNQDHGLGVKAYLAKIRQSSSTSHHITSPGGTIGQRVRLLISRFRVRVPARADGIFPFCYLLLTMEH
jgi:hypothetical protein